MLLVVEAEPPFRLLSWASIGCQDGKSFAVFSKMVSPDQRPIPDESRIGCPIQRVVHLPVVVVSVPPGLYNEFPSFGIVLVENAVRAVLKCARVWDCIFDFAVV